MKGRKKIYILPFLFELYVRLIIVKQLGLESTKFKIWKSWKTPVFLNQNLQQRKTWHMNSLIKTDLKPIF